MIPYYEERTSEIQIFRAANMQFALHLHDHIELLYLMEGKLEVLVGQTVHVLESGDFIAVFPNSIHSYNTPPGDSNAVCITIASPRLTGTFSGRVQKNHPVNPVIRRKHLHRDIPYAMKNLQKEDDSDSCDEAVVSAYLQLILARAFPCFTLEKNTDSTYFDLTYQIVNYVSQNFRQPFSLDIMARDLGISKYHLSRVFSSRLHTSFSDYLGSIRVTLAENLLRTTADSITKIAFDCGFESQRTFNRIFREKTGQTPSEYRRSLLP